MSAIEIQSIKFSIIELLVQSKNQDLISSIRDALERDIHQKDFYDELSEKDKTRITEAQLQIKEGKTHTHNDVMNEFRKKYKS